MCQFLLSNERCREAMGAIHVRIHVFTSSKRSEILDDEGSKSRRRLLIEMRVRRGYIGAKHRRNVLFQRVYCVCLTAR